MHFVAWYEFFEVSAVLRRTISQSHKIRKNIHGSVAGSWLILTIFQNLLGIFPSHLQVKLDYFIVISMIGVS